MKNTLNKINGKLKKRAMINNIVNMQQNSSNQANRDKNPDPAVSSIELPQNYSGMRDNNFMPNQYMATSLQGAQDMKHIGSGGYRQKQVAGKIGK